MAIGAVRALKDNGFSVPEDVSVVGFDTVEQAVRKMAVRSVEILLDSIKNGGESKHETVPFSVRLRESTKKI